MTELLHFPADLQQRMAAYLAPGAREAPPPSTLSQRPFVTLTYAASLDSLLALAPAKPTVLSGPASKAMTHYLRSAHDAIVVGSGTAAADDPTLNTRLDTAVGGGRDPLELQPRPIVLDRRGRWDVRHDSKVIKAAASGKGRAPWVIVSKDTAQHYPIERRQVLENVGGSILPVDVGTGGDENQSFFSELLDTLARKGIRSVMIEGGGQVIDNLLSLHADAVDSAIVTIAPIYLGKGGVEVCPTRQDTNRPAVEFHNVLWLPLENDVVMCAKIKNKENTP